MGAPMGHGDGGGGLGGGSVGGSAGTRHPGHALHLQRKQCCSQALLFPHQLIQYS